ncbi:MAG: hypothetical protein RLZZ597_1021 [Cyanobacteriota bacterium]
MLACMITKFDKYSIIIFRNSLLSTFPLLKRFAVISIMHEVNLDISTQYPYRIFHLFFGWP